MLEHQFIQFTEDLPTQEDCENFIPVDDKYWTTFYTKESDYPSDEYTQRCDLITPDGVTLKREITSVLRPYEFGESTSSKTTAVHFLKRELRQILSPGDCFRLRLMESKVSSLGLPGREGYGATRINYSYNDLKKHIYHKELSEYDDTGKESGYRLKNLHLPAGTYKITVKGLNMTAILDRRLGQRQCACKVAIFKEQSETYDQRTTNIIAEKRIEGTEDVSLEFTLKKEAYIQVGFASADDLNYFRGEYPAGSVGYTDIMLDQEEIIGYSNILQFIENQGEYSHLKYRCNEGNTFGIPWARGFLGSTTIELQNLVPLIVHKPQYGQDDKIYEKSNGEQVVLYANITKEYEGETDYINNELHEKIAIALNCDEVWINGERLTKSDKYEIDWDNAEKTECGQKIAQAKFKMKANVTARNGNC